MKGVAILGSTGSIGTQTLEVLSAHAERLWARVLVAGRNVELLSRQALLYKPSVAVIGDAGLYGELRARLSGSGVEVAAGSAAIAEVVTRPEVDVVVGAMVGFSGLRPTLSAIAAGKSIALANKETLVAAGSVVTAAARRRGVAILPVDSEHSAIFQSLNGERHLRPRKLILTASGGPFRGWSRERLASVTAAEALRNPNWSMGAKVTIDSASLMNKGFEAIEASWLFGVGADEIEIVVHPQSVVHSLVEYSDGSVKAQLAVPDMRVPIQYALSYPSRWPGLSASLDLCSVGGLTFERPDVATFRNLPVALGALRAGGTSGCVLNAADEVAVEAFRQGRIGFLQMTDVVERTLARVPVVSEPSLDDVFAADAEARRVAGEVVLGSQSA